MKTTAFVIGFVLSFVALYTAEGTTLEILARVFLGIVFFSLAGEFVTKK